MRLVKLIYALQEYIGPYIGAYGELQKERTPYYNPLHHGKKKKKEKRKEEKVPNQNIPH